MYACSSVHNRGHCSYSTHITLSSYPTYMHALHHSQRDTALSMSNIPSLHTTMPYSDTQTRHMYVCMHTHTHTHMYNRPTSVVGRYQ